METGAAPIVSADFVLLAARLAAVQPILFGARRGGTVTVALPLVRSGRTLHSIRSDHCPRVDLVGDARALPTLWRAIRAASWDLVELRSVPTDSPLALLLPKLARDSGCEVRVRETHRVPWFFVEGVEQNIHRRFRGDMRRLEKQLGGIELERVTRFDHQAMHDLVRLEAAAWKGEAGTAIESDPRVVHFYTAAARHFAHAGSAAIVFLRARGERIAAQFALEDRATYYLLKTGYDPQFAHYGPGQLLVRETAIEAAARGLVRYDLLGKNCAWKAKWTDTTRPHVAIRIYAPTALGRARCFAREVARPFAARALRTLSGAERARVTRS